jgi:hypothetical protein
MKFYEHGYSPYTHIIAIGERSGGNETVGDMWLETKLFEKTTRVEEIIKWAKEQGISGRLIITISEPDKLPVQF